MKKYQRLPLEDRKQEIQAAALSLFLRKGYTATTMENIVEKVSLSKGGVYRIYPSTAAILEDLILSGMRLRNAYYESRVEASLARGQALTLPFLLDMIGDSLLLYPEYSRIYVEFLWEKQRNPQLQALFAEINQVTEAETLTLIRRYGAQDLLSLHPDRLHRLTELMNSAILSIHVLGLQDSLLQDRQRLRAAILTLLNEEFHT